MVVTATVHQQNDVGKQRDVDSAQFGPTQSPLEPAVMKQTVTSHVQILKHKLHYPDNYRPHSTGDNQGDHSFSKMIFHDFSITFHDQKMNLHDLSAQHIFSRN